MTGTWRAAVSGLIDTPLFALALTLAAYRIGQEAQRLCRGAAWANPVLIAITLVVAVLLLTGLPYDRYFQQAQAIHLLLAPATVALAVPLAGNIRHLRRSAHALALALTAGSVTAIVTAVGLALACGAGRDVALSLAPRAVTTPIALAVAQTVGGIPALTAALVIISGILAAMSLEVILRRAGVTDWRAVGLAAGTAGSAIAAAQVVPRSSLAAAFAGLAVGLNGLLTAVLVPLLAGQMP